MPGSNPRETSPTAANRGAVVKKSLHQAISGIGEVRVHGQMYRVPKCEIVIDHSEESAVPGLSGT